jgi:indole-3-glycerol phosphate synthase
VNNRNLKDFTVDTENTKRLIDLIPPETVFVSESGIKTASDVAQIAGLGADAVLIGETLMRAADKKAMLEELRGR